MGFSAQGLIPVFREMGNNICRPNEVFKKQAGGGQVSHKLITHDKALEIYNKISEIVISGGLELTELRMTSSVIELTETVVDAGSSCDVKTTHHFCLEEIHKLKFK